MNHNGQGDVPMGNEAEHNLQTTGSKNATTQAKQVMLQAAEQAVRSERDPSRMLRVLAVLSAPVYDPRSPDHLVMPLDSCHSWYKSNGITR